MKLNIKTAVLLGTLLFTIAGFYYTTKGDINNLILKAQALESENNMQQKRLDTIDKKLSRMNKQLRELRK
tara:strand:- start:80810 stop:81019 length:210 start_codon:yes stop_codon:yes gene_type:complete